MAPTSNDSQGNNTNSSNNTNSDPSNNTDTTTVARKKIECDECGDSFENEDGLKDHMKDTHGAKIECEKCHRLFETREKRNKHRNMNICRKKKIYVYFFFFFIGNVQIVIAKMPTLKVSNNLKIQHTKNILMPTKT